MAARVQGSELRMAARLNTRVEVRQFLAEGVGQRELANDTELFLLDQDR